MHKTLAGLIIALLCSTANAFRQDHFALVLSPASSRLSQSTVVDIYQDSRGFVWILTEEGLNRFDGREVVFFRSRRGDESFLSNDSTSALVEDDAGILWVATLGGGLNRFDETSFTFEHLKAGNSVENSRPLSNFITTLKKSADGSIWVGYAGGVGFSRFDPREASFTHHFIPGQAANMDVEGFAETSDGRLIVAVANFGLLELEILSSVIQPLSNNYLDFQPSNPSSLIDIGDDRLLVTSVDAGAFIYDTSSSQLYRHPLHELVAAGSVLSMFSAMQDQEGNHWFGTSEGIAIYSPDNVLIWFNTFNSALPDNNVLAMLEADDGSFWLGTFAGLASGSKSKFQKLTEDDGLASNDVNSVFAKEDGRWWIGTSRGLTEIVAHRDNRGDWVIDSASPGIIADQQVMSILVDEEFVWAGTIDSGLFRISRSSGEVKSYFPSGEDGSITNTGVPALASLPTGEILVGTYGGGLNLFDPEAEIFASYTTSDNERSISDDRVLALLSDSRGNIWVGTQFGLNLFDRDSGTFRRFTYEQDDPSTLSASGIFALAEDKDGTIWIGTRTGGINLLTRDALADESASFSRLPANIDTVGSAIFSIQIADDGAAWVGGSNGLTRISLESQTSQQFDNRDGKIDGEFLTGASNRSPEGELFFGGGGGLNIISRDWVEPVVEEPRVYITGFNLLNEPVFFDQPYSELTTIELENDYQFASLSFTAIDFQKPESIKYRYRIDGLHNEWIDLGSVRQAFISGVPFGDFQLRIAASKSDGSWGETERRIGIKIAPPIWLTWYAYVTYFLLFVLLAFTVINRQRAREQQQLRRRLELEEKVEERTKDLSLARKEAEAAAKAKADFLAAMSHEIRTPMHGMIGMTDLLLQSGVNDRQREYALTAKQSGLSLLEIINSILDYSKLEAGKLEPDEAPFNVAKCIDDVAALLSQNAKHQSTRIYIHWLDCHAQIAVGDEGKLRQVLLNVLGNAIKFTSNGKVRLVCSLSHFEQRKLRLRIAVTDTGIGIQKDKLSKIFETFTQADASTTREYGGTGLGLSISHELAKLLGGTLLAESELGEGSTFTLEMPLTVDHRTQKGLQHTPKPDLSVSLLFEDKDAEKAVASKLKLAGLKSRRINDGPDSESNVIFCDMTSLNRLSQTVGQQRPKTILVTEFDDLAHESDVDGILYPPYRLENLLLLVDEADAPSDTDQKKLGTVPTDSMVSSQVLLVEDVKVNQQIATVMLQAMGASIVVAENGLEAVKAFREANFDLILMDCQMPLLDGYEATRRIRSIEEKNSLGPTPIFALTAGGDLGEEEKSIASGMNGLIRKPFTFDQLAQLVRGKSENESKPAVTAIETEEDLSSKVDQDVFSNFESILSGDQNGLASQLINGYVTQGMEKLGMLVEAIGSGDTKAVKSCAHAIKSMSANMGAVVTKEIAEEIERTPEKYLSASSEEVRASIEREIFGFERIFNNTFR